MCIRDRVITAISLVTGVSGATITLTQQAVLELAKLTGKILKSNSADFVDFFQGCYSADKEWKVGYELYSGNSSKIVLEKL